MNNIITRSQLWVSFLGAEVFEVRYKENITFHCSHLVFSDNKLVCKS